MPYPPATINKQKDHPYEENSNRTCFHCSESKTTNWRMVGFDEYGELWICPECWDQATDTSQAQPDEMGENEEL